jgi:hypothetical protein
MKVGQDGPLRSHLLQIRSLDTSMGELPYGEITVAQIISQDHQDVCAIVIGITV